MTEIKIFFDGGTDGLNGYGSWEVVWPGFNKMVSRESYLAEDYELPSITNNSAEYLALMSALIWLGSDASPIIGERSGYLVKISGDSKLVLLTLSGEYKTKKKHLIMFRDRCRTLLKGLNRFDVQWYPRWNNVRRFGH